MHSYHSTRLSKLIRSLLDLNLQWKWHKGSEGQAGVEATRPALTGGLSEGTGHFAVNRGVSLGVSLLGQTFPQASTIQKMKPSRFQKAL